MKSEEETKQHYLIELVKELSEFTSGDIILVTTMIQNIKENGEIDNHDQLMAAVYTVLKPELTKLALDLMGSISIDDILGGSEEEK